MNKANYRRLIDIGVIFISAGLFFPATDFEIVQIFIQDVGHTRVSSFQRGVYRFEEFILLNQNSFRIQPGMKFDFIQRLEICGIGNCNE